MSNDITIARATADDLALLKRIYADAAEIQRAQGAPEWPPFADAQLLGEIGERRIFIVSDRGSVAGIFTLAYDDPWIWEGEREEREAYVYLHRIARPLQYSGRGFLDVVLEWVWTHARALGRRGLRIDTWADNPALVSLYERKGFTFVGTRRLPHDPRLLPHYHGIELALLEWEDEAGAEKSVERG